MDVPRRRCDGGVRSGQSGISSGAHVLLGSRPLHVRDSATVGFALVCGHPCPQVSCRFRGTSLMPELWSGCAWVNPVRGYFDVGPEREPDGYVRAGMPADQCSSHPCLLTLIRTVLGAHYPSACPPREPAFTRSGLRYGGFRTGPRASLPHVSQLNRRTGALVAA